MIRVKKILKFISVLEIYYEEESVVLSTIQNTPHVFARIYSYVPLLLPSAFALTRKKETTRVILREKNSDSLLASFRKNYRNEIRKTISMDGVKVKAVNGFSQEGYDTYRRFELLDGRKPAKPRYMKGLWMLVYHDDKLVSGVFLIEASPVLKIVAIFSDRHSRNRDESTTIAMLSKRLMYETGLQGIRRGYDYLDLAYINRTDPAKAGITAYKLGFGGEALYEYHYEKKTLAIDLLRKIKKVLMR